jgi:hypothetical protein
MEINKMDDLLREAIADAKAVRETALENAKIALEEAFTPRLQSMLSKKIQSEMEDSEENEDAEEMEMDEAEDAEETEDSEEMRETEDHDEMDAEEMMDKDESEMEEEEAEESEAEESEMEEEEAEETEDSEEMRGMEEEEAEENDAEESEMEEMEDKDEEELDLESVLAELEKDLEDEDDVEEMEDKDEEEKVDENDVSSEIGAADNKVNPEANDSTKSGAQGPEGEGSDKKAGTELGDHTVVKETEDKEEEEMEEVEDKDENDLDLDEVLRALTEEDAEEQDAEENEKLKAEIKEHRKVIHFMRSKLNEVNLLNAKLLFSNKLFRAFGLNNNQKLKVVETFDRTTNLREVKLVYATLAESFKGTKSKLSESVKKGSSSKPTRSTKPAKAQVLSEGQELKARFKKLANIL